MYFGKKHTSLNTIKYKLKILFYLCSIPKAITVFIFFEKAAKGTANGPVTPIEKVVTIIASTLVFRLLWWAYKLLQQDKGGLGLGVVFLSWFVFAAIMLVNGYFETKLWN